MELPKTPNSFIDYDYSVWPAGTRLTMTNVPWDSNYRDIVRFKSPEECQKYVRKDGFFMEIEAVTYCPPNRPVRINTPFSVANMYNYIMIENPAQPIAEDKPTVFYYFVNDVRYVSPNTTELDLQLDVWTTYNFTIRPGRAYLERGHIGIAADDAMHEYGRSYLTVPEGFDLGGEYMTPITSYKAFGEYKDGPYDQDRMQDFYILVGSSISLRTDPGTVKEPKIKTARGWAVFNSPTALEYYAIEPVSWSNFLDGLSEYPWIAQGIQSITLIPRYFLTNTLRQAALFGKSSLVNNRTGTGGFFMLYNVPRGYNYFTVGNLGASLHQAFRGLFAGIIESLDDNPKEGDVRSNKDLYKDNWNDSGVYMPVFKGRGRYRYLYKFLTYPYSCIELTTLTGTPVQYRPENIQATDIQHMGLVNFIEPNPRAMFFIAGYNSFTDNRAYSAHGDDTHLWCSDGFDRMTGFSAIPHYSAPTDQSLLAQAQSAHSIAYSKQSADWAQQRALNSAQVSRDNSMRSINSAYQQSEVGRGAQQRSTDIANQQAIMGAIGNGAMGLLGSVASGNLFGGVMGAASTAFNTGLQNQTREMQTANSIAASRATSGMQRATATSNVDANWNLSLNTIHGDYANSIAGINAKVQDSELVAPSIIGQAGGENLISAAFGWKLFTRFKTISRNAIKVIGEYWLRYGYAMNVWITVPDNFQCMTKFTHWKLQDFRITTSVCPELYRNTIRGIFERGTTVWSNPDEIGVVDTATNEPVHGITIGRYNK